MEGIVEQMVLVRIDADPGYWDVILKKGWDFRMKRWGKRGGVQLLDIHHFSHFFFQMTVRLKWGGHGQLKSRWRRERERCFVLNGFADWMTGASCRCGSSESIHMNSKWLLSMATHVHANTHARARNIPLLPSPDKNKLFQSTYKRENIPACLIYVNSLTLYVRYIWLNLFWYIHQKLQSGAGFFFLRKLNDS